MKMPRFFEARKREENGKHYVDHYVNGTLKDTTETKEEMRDADVELFSNFMNNLLTEKVFNSLLYGREESDKMLNEQLDQLAGMLKEMVGEEQE